MKSMWEEHGEAITTILCGAFVVTGALVREHVSIYTSSSLFLIGYIAGGYDLHLRVEWDVGRLRELANAA